MTTVDRILLWVIRALAAVSGVLVLLVSGFLILGAIPALRHVGATRFLLDPSWHPADPSTRATFGMLPMIVGSLAATLGAIVLVGPIGLASAIYCRFYAPAAVARWYRRIIELLAGIPSVVYGFWGLVFLVPLVMRLRPPGQCLLSGILILTFMILPTMSLIADAALGTVPAEILRGAAALGLGRWTIVRRVAMPACRSGLCTALILSTGRAIGETMVVLMVCGNVARMPRSVMDPVRTLTANIALELAYAQGDHRSALFVTGGLLLVLVLALVLSAELISGGRIHE